MPDLPFINKIHFLQTPPPPIKVLTLFVNSPLCGWSVKWSQRFMVSILKTGHLGSSKKYFYFMLPFLHQAIKPFKFKDFKGNSTHVEKFSLQLSNFQKLFVLFVTIMIYMLNGWNGPEAIYKKGISLEKTCFYQTSKKSQLCA